MSTHNPNWPLIDDAISWSSGPGTTPPFPFWCSIVERSTGQWQATRGRQYEIDQVQTGTVTSRYLNNDAAFDPTNASSPFHPNVVPYRAYRRRAQYPATVNILVGDQAAAGAVSGSTVLPPNVTTGIYPMSITAAHVYSVTLPASPTFGIPLLSVFGWSVLPSTTFAGQVKVTASASTSLKVRFRWYDATGAIISVVDGTPVSVTAATVISVTGTAPATAVGADVSLMLNSSPAGAVTVTAVNWQVERANSISAYAQPNPWYGIFAGFVERYPQAWQMNGQYGTVDLTIVDAFGWLSQQVLRSPAYMELLQMGPNFLYPLDEATDATTFTDFTAQRAPASLVNMNVAPATAAVPGTDLSATNAEGISGPVVQFNNYNPTTGTGPQIVVSLPGVGAPTSGGFTRIMAVRVTTPPTGGTGMVFWGAATHLGNAGPGFSIGMTSTGLPQFGMGGAVLTGTASIADGNWHLLGLSVFDTGLTVIASIDTAFAAQVTASVVDVRFAATTDIIGGFSYVGQPALGAAASIGLICELPGNITVAEWALISSAFFYGGSGFGTASSATRYADFLRWAGFGGPALIDTYASGETNNYGPATEILAAAADSGLDTVSALQSVVDTENGTHFADRDGNIVLKARRDRYNRNTVLTTWGEHDSAGEVPYGGDVSFGLDPSRLATDVTLTQTFTNNPVRVADLTAMVTYGDLTLQRNVNTLSVLELIDAATFLCNRFKVPMQRLETLSINIGAAPSRWAAALQAELSNRDRVMRRPPAGTSPTTAPPVIQFDGFVEQLVWTMDDAGNASLSLQISPAQGLAFWEVGSSHTTLHTAVSANGTSMIINALPDAATNPVQANINADTSTPAWVIDWGTANAEFVTVTSVTPGSTGYTTAALAIGLCYDVVTGASGTGFRHAHSVGAVIQDLGGLLTAVGNASSSNQLASYLVPPSALDALSTVGTSTIAGY